MPARRYQTKGMRRNPVPQEKERARWSAPAGKGHTQNQRVRHLPSGSDAYAPAPLEKLATASASELKTSKTVSNFVICKTSWNFEPRWQRRREAPCDFTL